MESLPLEGSVRMADRVNQQLGHYRLIRHLGRGGFAEVYLGEHLYLNTKAAIKVLQTRLSGSDLPGFIKEARTIAGLSHPHIIRVLDFGLEDETPFLVMEYAPNGTLRQRFPKGTRLPLTTILPFVKQMAEALQYAHDQRLVHRDVKPENMLLGPRNELLLSDFGIAFVTQTSRQQTTQEIVGTAAYMAPEQLQGRPQPASDQYALGIVIYEWLSGDRPFHGTFTEVASQHLFVPPPPLRQKLPDISPEVEHIMQTALEKDPQKRFVTVQAFARALEQASISPSQMSTLADDSPTYITPLAPPPPVYIPASTYTPTPPPPPPSSLSPYHTPSPGDALTRPAQISHPGLPISQPGLPLSQPGLQIPPDDRTRPPQPGISRRALLIGLGGLAIGSGIAGVLLYQHFQSPGVTTSPTPTPTTNPTLTSHPASPSPNVTPTTAPTVTSTSSAPPTLGATLAVFKQHTDQVTTVAWAPNDAHVIASGSNDKTVQIWSVSTLAASVRHAQAKQVYSLSWSPSGRYIASGGENPTIEVWDASNGNTILQYPGHSNPVFSVVWSPDGNNIASGSSDNTAQVWNASSGSLVTSYKQHTQRVWALAWSSDSSKIASASWDGTVQIWDANTGANILTYHDPAGGHVQAVAWSPNGQYIASGGDGKTVQVWQVSTGNVINTYSGHSNTIEDVQWSPNGTRIASASKDGTVQVWDATTGGNPYTYTGHTGLVWALAWSANGQSIASAAADNTVRVWQAS